MSATSLEAEIFNLRLRALEVTVAVDQLVDRMERAEPPGHPSAIEHLRSARARLGAALGHFLVARDWQRGPERRP